MSTAELKSLLENRRREKVDQDEREQLLKEIRELDAYASENSESAEFRGGIYCGWGDTQQCFDTSNCTVYF